MRALTVVLMLTLLTGCNSLNLRNLGKSGASAGVAYVINPIAGVATLATSMAYDEIIPDQPSVETIKTKEQSAAYIAESLFMNVLYGFLGYLIITLIAVPFISRYGYNKAKAKYRRKDDE